LPVLVKSFSYRTTKNLNIDGETSFYYVRLINEERKESEVEDGKHIIE
jgi:hypothetical protein